MKRNNVFNAAAAAAAASLIFFTGCKEDPAPVGPPAGDGFTLTTTASPPAGGAVSRAPDRTAYADGDAVIVTAKPDTANGYSFAGWAGAATGTTNPVTVIMDGNKTLTATFTKEGVDPPIIIPPGGHWYESDTAAATFYISTAADLAELAELVNGGKTFANKTVVLANDISLAAYDGANKNFNGGKGWIPIGKYNSTASDNRPFTGIFNGNGKEVSGLFINDNANDYNGIFGYVGVSGEVRNLGSVDVNIYGRQYTGGVVGSVASDGVVENCYSSGIIRASGNNLGGVIGYVNGSVLKCYSTAMIEGLENVGGVAGYVNEGASVNESYYNGEANGTNNTGGVAGHNRGGSVSDCHAAGKVYGTNNVGGVVGLMGSNNLSRVVTSYSESAVSGNNNVGGVVGRGEYGSVNNCYSTSTVKGAEYVGGVVGYASLMGGITYSYSTGEVTGEKLIGGVAGYIDESTVSSCAALNPNLKGDADVFRIGTWWNDGSKSTRTGNVAFSGIMSNNEAIEWPSKGLGTANGADITVAQILSDPTMDNRFRAIAGWTIEPGKLPGLLGKAVDLPAHLAEEP